MSAPGPGPVGTLLLFQERLPGPGLPLPRLLQRMTGGIFHPEVLLEEIRFLLEGNTANSTLINKHD